MYFCSSSRDSLLNINVYDSEVKINYFVQNGLYGTVLTAKAELNAILVIRSRFWFSTEHNIAYM